MSQTYFKLLHFFMKLAPLGGPKSLPKSPKSLPKWSKIELASFLQPQKFPSKATREKSPLETILEAIWGRSGGSFWSQNRSRKRSYKPLQEEASFRSQKIILFNQNPRFLRPPGRPEAKKIWQEDDSIAEPSKP